MTRPITALAGLLSLSLATGCCCLGGGGGYCGYGPTPGGVNYGPAPMVAPGGGCPGGNCQTYPGAMAPIGPQSAAIYPAYSQTGHAAAPAYISNGQASAAPQSHARRPIGPVYTQTAGVPMEAIPTY